jgi:hypothetical protein
MLLWNATNVSQARKQISYAESSDEDEDVFVAMKATQRRHRNRTRTVADDDDDEDYASGGGEDVAADEDGTSTISSILCSPGPH